MFEIPVELRHNLPTTEVRIAGTTLELFLDLGGYQPISLTPEELERTPVRFTGATTKYQNANGTVFHAREFIAEEVAFGDQSVGPLNGGEFLLFSGGPPDKNGYIGAGLLARFLLVLDYPKSRVRLYKSGDTRALSVECGRETFKLEVVNGVVQSIVSTEHGDLIAEWDTGSTHNVVRPSALPRAISSTAQRIDDGPPVHVFSSFRIGEREFGPQEFRLRQFGAPDVDAVIGTGFLNTQKVCLDIPARKGSIAPRA